MARYTELFQEYLDEGYTLPSSFSLIEGFDELFIAYYCDKEIGFETEELFEIKLDLYAKLLMPRYAERIEKIAIAYGLLDTPARTRYEAHNTTLGSQRGTQTELPIDSEDAQPNMITTSDEVENTTESNIEEVSIDDKIRLYDRLNEKVEIILKELLEAFGPCFMSIY